MHAAPAHGNRHLSPGATGIVGWLADDGAEGPDHVQPPGAPSPSRNRAESPAGLPTPRPQLARQRFGRLASGLLTGEAFGELRRGSGRRQVDLADCRRLDCRLCGRSRRSSWLWCGFVLRSRAGRLWSESRGHCVHGVRSSSLFVNSVIISLSKPSFFRPSKPCCSTNRRTTCSPPISQFRSNARAASGAADNSVRVASLMILIFFLHHGLVSAFPLLGLFDAAGNGWASNVACWYPYPLVGDFFNSSISCSSSATSSANRWSSRT